MTFIKSFFLRSLIMMTFYNLITNYKQDMWMPSRASSKVLDGNTQVHPLLLQSRQIAAHVLIPVLLCPFLMPWSKSGVKKASDIRTVWTQLSGNFSSNALMRGEKSQTSNSCRKCPGDYPANGRPQEILEINCNVLTNVLLNWRECTFFSLTDKSLQHFQH